MLAFLKNHPFAVQAYFDSSTVLTYAVPMEQLAHRIPECLQLDTYEDKWGFVAVAMVQTRELRPMGFPRFMGNDFFLIGYRIFVRYQDVRGKRLRGLYILKSQTDKKKMERLGSIFTQYNYDTIDIGQAQNGSQLEISSQSADFRILLDTEVENPPLPTGSPFPDWKTARRYAGPLPFTFTYKPERKEVLIVEGVRQNWKPAPFRYWNTMFRCWTHWGWKIRYWPMRLSSRTSPTVGKKEGQNHGNPEKTPARRAEHCAVQLALLCVVGWSGFGVVGGRLVAVARAFGGAVFAGCCRHWPADYDLTAGFALCV